MEGTIDAIARELSIDPVAVRRLNSIVKEDLPFVTITGETYVDVTPRETLEAAVAAVDYETARARQARAREAGRLVGLGLCTVMELTTYGSEFYKKAGIPGSGHEVAVIRMEPTGAVLVSCGLMASGQGYETTSRSVLPKVWVLAWKISASTSVTRILLHTEWVAAAREEEPQGEGSCCSPGGGSRQRSSQSPPT